MTTLDPTAFRADDDATPLDRSIMALARQLAEAGWEEQAHSLASCAATMREHPKVATATPLEAFDVLQDLAAAAESAAAIIGATFPDEIALRRKD